MTLPALGGGSRNYLVQRNLAASDNKCYMDFVASFSSASSFASACPKPCRQRRGRNIRKRLHQRHAFRPVVVHLQSRRSLFVPVTIPVK